MKKTIILLALVLMANVAFAITVDGYAYLENQTDHSGIRILFERSAPSFLVDSVYTDLSGYFNLDIETGIYEISYSKQNYDTFIINGQALYSSSTLPDITLTEHLTLLNVPSDFTTIQSAINYAWEADTVLVQPGTYYENINFSGKNITVASMYLSTQDTTYITQTIINGNQNGTVVAFLNGEDSTSVLCGFTITNGNATSGGGVKCSQASPTLCNLIITGNSAIYSGGGIQCNNSSPIIFEVNISNNNAEDGGGIWIYSNPAALYNPTLTNVSIFNNYADCGNDGRGGGVFLYASYANFENVNILNNYAFWTGGGIHCEGIGSFNNVIIQGNNSHLGGGLYIYGAWQTLSFTNVTFNNNTANNGGGLFIGSGSFTFFENVLFDNNIANINGGGIYGSGGSYNNITVINNSSLNNGGGIFCTGSNMELSNSIVNNNLGNYGIFVDSGSPSITFSDFYNNENGNFFNCGYAGVNVTVNANGDSCDAYSNIQFDPLFVDPDNENYQLSSNSPCIDAGDPSSSLDPDGTIVDMGRYYFNQNGPSANFTADTTNGTTPLIINFSDLSNAGLLGNPIISWNWDFNNDGTIDSNVQNPQWNYYIRGNYSVTLTVFDGTYEDTAIKEDYIELLNSQPIIQNQIDDFSFDEDTSNSTINLNNVFNDPDLPYGDELTFSYSGNTNIQVEIASGFVTLTPTPDWFGSEVITFTATDDQNDSVSDEVVITINPINDPPILNITGAFEADEDLPSQTYDFSGFCTQTFGETDVLTLTADNSTHINVTITDFDVVFESNTTNWNGTEDITFYLNDNVTLIADSRNLVRKRNEILNRDIVEQTVSVNINPVNDPPTIVLPDDFTFEEDGQLVENFSSYISDIDDDDLTLSVQGNDNVLVDIAGAEVTFSSVENWNGTETLTFIVDDNQTRATAEDNVDVIVIPVNDEPVLLGFVPEELTFTLIQDSLVTFSVDVEDIDSDLIYVWFVDNDLQTEVTEEFIYQFVTLGEVEIKSVVSDEEYSLETIWFVSVEPASGSGEIVPLKTALFQNYPNPFNPSTTIKYNLKKTSNIRIDLFNIKGHRIMTLVNQIQNAGYHSVVWVGNGEYSKPVRSGIYFYKLKVDGKTEAVKKCLLLK